MNDFMLSQNELKISKIMIMEIINRENFNKKSLGGPGLPDTVDLTRFKAVCDSLYQFRKDLDGGRVDSEVYGKVVWFIEPRDYDMDAFYRNIGLRL